VRAAWPSIYSKGLKPQLIDRIGQQPTLQHDRFVMSAYQTHLKMSENASAVGAVLDRLCCHPLEPKAKRQLQPDKKMHRLS
jgi:hypothetical protein